MLIVLHVKAVVKIFTATKSSKFVILRQAFEVRDAGDVARVLLLVFIGPAGEHRVSV